MLGSREAVGQVPAELVHQQRDTFFAPARVAQRILHQHLRQRAAITETHAQAVGDAALVGIQVIGAELRVFMAGHLRPQRVDARIGSHVVLVILGHQPPMQQRDGHHVLHAVIAVGRVVQRPLLVDDADAGLLGTDRDVLDVLDLPPQRAQLMVQQDRCLHRRLPVELGRETDLEQHVFHHVAAERAAEGQRLAMHRYRLEAPGRCTEHAGVAHLAGGGHQRQAHATAGRVTGCPALARAGVGRMPVGAQRLPIHPGQRHRIEHALAVQPEHLRDDGGGGHLDQQHVVQADPVEGVLQRQHALDLVRLDHRQQHVVHGRWWASQRSRIAAEPVGYGEDAPQVVRGVAPFGGQPGVVEIQPADHRADVERGLHGVKLERRAGHLGAVWHHGAGHDRPQQLLARRVFQRFQAAAQRVDQAVACGLVRQAALDLVVENVVRDIGQHLVGIGTYV
ncbi:hypothetical protein D3C72_854950 [compost metagenome]